MGKLSYNDKLRMQTLRDQGLGEKPIISSYPDKGWKLSTVKKICSRVDRTAWTILRKPDSGSAIWRNIKINLHKLVWIANKSAKFHAKRLNRSENIPKCYGGGVTFFLKYLVDDGVTASILIVCLRV